MRRTLGNAVIGQAPRTDIAALFAAQAPEGTRIVMRGCLDGLTDAGQAGSVPAEKRILDAFPGAVIEE